MTNEEKQMMVEALSNMEKGIEGFKNLVLTTPVALNPNLETRIVEFIESSEGVGLTFRSTTAIANALIESETAVAATLGASDKVRRNYGEKESWCLVD